MLNRQKVLIELLRTASRPVGKIELMKWCFLLRQDWPNAGGSAFYDFLPYHFGPYSFCLNRELTALSEMGYVTETPNSWSTTDQSTAVASPTKSVSADVAGVIRRYATINADALLDHVYKRFPEYTVNSKRRRLATRPKTEPAIFTVGYEGLQVDGFLRLLIASGIRRLIDVRSNPIARRYGFHKSTLGNLCAKLDIDYRHVPELGISSSDRRATDASIERLFTMYTSVTLPSQTDAVNRIVELMTEQPSALMCMEATPCDCHRSHLAVVVAERTGLPIQHLGVDDDRGTATT